MVIIIIIITIITIILIIIIITVSRACATRPTTRASRWAAICMCCIVMCDVVCVLLYLLFSCVCLVDCLLMFVRASCRAAPCRLSLRDDCLLRVVAPYSHTGVCEKTFPSGEPLPCSPAAETALQPLICAFKASCPKGLLRRSAFFTDAERYRQVAPPNLYTML